VCLDFQVTGLVVDQCAIAAPPAGCPGAPVRREDGLMELTDALRSTGAIREFTDAPVTDDVLARVLDNARFAPSGGNAQSWRVVVVKDAGIRAKIRDLYLTGWYEYLAQSRAHLRPWSPVNDRAEESEAIHAVPDIAEAARTAPGFAEHLDQAPVLLVLFADLAALATPDRDFDRYSFAGGASVYPFAWSILLAGREEGLGGVITTMAIREEPAVNALLGATGSLALAGVIALGHPVHQPTKLRRAAVASFTTVDSIDGAPLGGGG